MGREIEGFREEIAAVDTEMLKLFKKRMTLSRKIGDLKRRDSLEIVDYKAESSVLERAERIARDEDLDLDLAKRLVSSFIQESVHIQSQRPKNRAEYLYSIFEKAETLKDQGQKLIRLDVGEPDLTVPQQVKDTLCMSLYKNEHIGYVSSKGLLELRQAIASMLNGRYGTDLKANQVLITPGGKFSIFSAILSMISQEDRAIIPEPTWPVYGNVVRLAGGRQDILHTSFENEWDIDMSKLIEMLQVHPKLLILCSPNNPSGKVFDENMLREMVEATRKAGGYVLADEVYESYASVPTDSILQVADSNFIYVNTFSKRYGMTGWRIGYVVSDSDIVSRIQSILQLSVTCVPEFIQYAALSALTMEQEVYDEYARKMQRRVNLVCNELDKLPVKYVRPEGGMYVYPRAREDDFDSKVFACRLLEDKGIAITPGEAFGDYPEHFRIALGTCEEDIREGIRGIGESLQSWLKK